MFLIDLFYFEHLFHFILVLFFTRVKGHSRPWFVVSDDDDDGFNLYSSRWIMLFYLSILNLLSDWTCYSVAPITSIVEDKYTTVSNESLVTLFLGANAIASVCEPAILGRLGK